MPEPARVELIIGALLFVAIFALLAAIAAKAAGRMLTYR